MNEKDIEKKYIIENGDILEFKYRIKPKGYEDSKLFRIDEPQTIVVGKNQLITGLDEFLVGKNSSDKIEIKDFHMPEDHLMFPNEIVHVGIKVLKHEKQETKEVLEPSIDVKNTLDTNERIKILEDENQELRERIEELEQELNENLEMFKSKREETIQRAQDEVVKIKNEIKESAKREIDENKKYALQKFLENLLDPMNNLYLSVDFGSSQPNPEISAYVKGFQLIVNQLFQILENHGIRIIQPNEGELFDPEFDEVYEVIETDDFEKDQIVKVISRGYELNGRVLKPSKVIVAK